MDFSSPAFRARAEKQRKRLASFQHTARNAHRIVRQHIRTYVAECTNEETIDQVLVRLQQMCGSSWAVFLAVRWRESTVVTRDYLLLTRRRVDHVFQNAIQQLLEQPNWAAQMTSPIITIDLLADNNDDDSLSLWLQGYNY